MKKRLESIGIVILGLFIFSIPAFGVDWSDPNVPNSAANLPPIDGVAWPSDATDHITIGDSEDIDQWTVAVKTHYVNLGGGKIRYDLLSLSLQLIDGEWQWVQSTIQTGVLDYTPLTNGNYTRTADIITDENGEQSLKITETWTTNGETSRQLTTIVDASGDITLSLSDNFVYGDPNPGDNVGDHKLLSYDTRLIKIKREGATITDWSREGLASLIDTIGTNSEALNHGGTLQSVAEAYNGEITANQAMAETNRVYNDQGQLVRSITMVTNYLGNNTTTTIYANFIRNLADGVGQESAQVQGTFR